MRTSPTPLHSTRIGYEARNNPNRRQFLSHDPLSDTVDECYGTEGQGFESLRARLKPRNQRGFPVRYRTIDAGRTWKAQVVSLKFSGRIANRKATGTYQSKSDPEGGIDKGYCRDAKPVPWTATRGALPPLPPGSV